MEPVIKVKLELVIRLKDIETALRKRGIVVNQANIKRLTKMVADNPLKANSEFLEDVPMDRTTLLMYGFTFQTSKGGH
jgi:hypothetical protein